MAAREPHHFQLLKSCCQLMTSVRQRVSFKGVVPSRLITLQSMSVWAVQIGLGRLLYF